MSSPEIISTSGSGEPILGIRTDVYERRLEFIWMTKDDIETFEERIQDKSSFKDWSLILISGALPLGLDKGMNYRAKHEETDLALFIICIAAFLLGSAFALGARKRQKKVETFKDRLFKQERLLATRISMVNSGSDKSPPIQAMAEN